MVAEVTAGPSQQINRVPGTRSSWPTGNVVLNVGGGYKRGEPALYSIPLSLRCVSWRCAAIEFTLELQQQSLAMEDPESTTTGSSEMAVKPMKRVDSLDVESNRVAGMPKSWSAKVFLACIPFQLCSLMRELFERSGRGRRGGSGV